MTLQVPQAGRNAGPAPVSAETGRLRRTIGLRAKSLIVTIFGDSLQVHGGGAWLGTLINLAGLFDISERQVRTAVYRLKQDGWLVARKSGRQSYYRLTADAQRQFHNAEDRIYGVPADEWDGKWTFVLLSDDLPRRQREALTRELNWAGFAAFAPNILAYPGGTADKAGAAGLSRSPDGRMLTLEAATLPGYTPGLVRRIIAENWKLESVRDSYADFISNLEPVEKALSDGAAPGQEEAFILRTMLIDQFRKVLLKDPALPLPLLPAHWPGRRASDLTQAIYRATALPGQAYVARMIDGAQAGPSRPLPASFLSRFGGL